MNDVNWRNFSLQSKSASAIKLWKQELAQYCVIGELPVVLMDRDLIEANRFDSEYRNFLSVMYGIRMIVVLVIVVVCKWIIIAKSLATYMIAAQIIAVERTPRKLPAVSGIARRVLPAASPNIGASTEASTA